MQRSRTQCSVRVWTVAAFTLSGCVPGVPHFVTAAESRAGHPYEDAEYGSADLALQAPTPPLPAAVAGSVTTASYWHWNGLGYEWVPSAHETSDPAYLWRWQDDPQR